MANYPTPQELHEHRRTQQHYVTTAVVQQNVRVTTALAIGVLEKISQRGAQMDECATRSDVLLESSRAFVVRALPWWRRCWPDWWPNWWFLKCGGG
jgi:hypothetical protein